MSEESHAEVLHPLGRWKRNTIFEEPEEGDGCWWLSGLRVEDSVASYPTPTSHLASPSDALAPSPSPSQHFLTRIR